jgi:hypothetical protein
MSCALGAINHMLVGSVRRQPPKRRARAAYPDEDNLQATGIATEVADGL